jgi:hypothetical protein
MPPAEARLARRKKSPPAGSFLPVNTGSKIARLCATRKKEAVTMKKFSHTRKLAVFLALSLVLASPGGFFSFANAGRAETPLLNVYAFIDGFRGDIPMTDYAGLYFGDDGKLVVNVIGDERRKASVVGYVEKYGGHLGVKIVEQKHTLAELMKALAILSEDLEGHGLLSAGLNEKLNRVCVDVRKIDASLEASLEKLVDMALVQLRETDLAYTLTSTVTVTPGSAGVNANGAFTVAWGALHDGDKGFLIPGHASTATSGATVLYESYVLGTTSASYFSEGRDAAFVSRSTSPDTFVCNEYFPENSIAVPYNISSNFTIGQPLYAYGAVSGLQTGAVLETNYSTVFDGVTQTGLIKSSYRAVEGDSGAPVFHVFVGPVTPQAAREDPAYITAAFGMQSGSALAQTGAWVEDSFSVFSTLSTITSGTGISLDRFTD